MYIRDIYLYIQLISHVPLVFRVSWLLSATRTTHSWLRGQRTRRSWWSWFRYPRYTSSVRKIHDPYVQAGGCWVPGARTGWVKVQGPGRLLLPYNKYIRVICITYTMHIPCIPRKFKVYIQKILIGYILYMPSISQVYCVYKHHDYCDIYHAYTM